MKRYAYTLAAVLALSACADIEKDELGVDKPTSNVKTTETTAGVITGEFNKDATGTQRLVGSAASVTSETYIDIAPGSLSIPKVDLTMQEGSDMGSALPTELGLGDVAILGGSHATMLGASPAGDLSSPSTLNIPLPLGQVGGVGLNLTAAEAGKVGILYLVKTSAGNKLGLFIFGEDDLVGTIVKYKGASFGWFRIVVLSSAVETKEVSTTMEPAAKA